MVELQDDQTTIHIRLLVTNCDLQKGLTLDDPNLDSFKNNHLEANGLEPFWQFEVHLDALQNEHKARHQQIGAAIKSSGFHWLKMRSSEVQIRE